MRIIVRGAIYITDNPLMQKERHMAMWKNGHINPDCDQHNAT